MNYRFRRIIACIIDLFLVVLMTSMISNVPSCNPRIDDYNELIEKYNKETTVMLNKISSGEKVQFTKSFKDIVVKTDKSSLFVIIWFLIFSFLYFVLFQYYTGGQTLGKKLFSLQVVSNDGELKLSQLFKRTLLVGSSLFNGVIVFLILKVILSLINLSTNAYFVIYFGLTTASIIFEIVFIINYLLNKEGKALDDIFAKTRVVDLRF